MREHIFISYRRDDARGASGRLRDWLCIAFGRERVFRDVHSMGAGRWRGKIDAALAKSAVCVAVIGTRWANAENLHRLHHDPNCMVRHELATALATNEMTLVPALVEGAMAPQAAELPEALRPLLDWNFLAVTEEGWEDDTRRLIAAIEREAKLHAQADLGELLRNAGEAKQRLAAAPLEAGQLDALRRTVDDLTRKLAEAKGGERPALAEAFAALARGDSLAAEDAFEREFEDEAHAAAEAARNVANLALLHDVAKAVRFYREALRLEPEHAETSRLLGLALMTLGDLKGAEAAFSRSLEVAVTQGDAWGDGAAQCGLGDVFWAVGNLEGALAAYRGYRAIAEALAARDPANTGWQRDLSVSHDRIGDVLVAQGDGPGALAAYRKGLDIRMALAARDPANMGWQRDLSVSHNKIGDVLVAQGDGPGALAAYRKGLGTAEALAARDPANTEWQRDLSVSHDKIGNVLVAQGDGPAALAAYRKGLDIAEALAARDPANTGWRRDLSVSHEKIGNVLVAQGDGPGALAAYRKSLDIREALTARDPANTGWQRDLSVSHDRIGNVLVAQGDGPGALAAYRKGLDIRMALAARDPANMGWQRDLSVSHNKIGDVLVAQGDGPAALAAYRKGLDIREALAARDPANAGWQRDLSVSHEKIGDVLVALGEDLGDGPGALAAYRKSLDIREALAARDPANTGWQRDLSVSHEKIGDVLVALGDDLGDGPGALAAYRKGLDIREALAARDPANMGWQRDLIVSFWKLNDATGDRTYAAKALEIALGMHARGALRPVDAWFIEALRRRAEG